MNLEHIKGKTTIMIFLNEKNENWIGMNSTATELRLLSKINSMLKYSREYDLCWSEDSEWLSNFIKWIVFIDTRLQRVHSHDDLVI